MSVNTSKTNWETAVEEHNKKHVSTIEIVDGQGSLEFKLPKQEDYWNLDIQSDSIQTLEIIGK